MASCFGKKGHSVARGLGDLQTTQKARTLPNQKPKDIMQKGLRLARWTMEILLFIPQCLEA